MRASLAFSERKPLDLFLGLRSFYSLHPRLYRFIAFGDKKGSHPISYSCQQENHCMRQETSTLSLARMRLAPSSSHPVVVSCSIFSYTRKFSFASGSYLWHFFGVEIRKTSFRHPYSV